MKKCKICGGNCVSTSGETYECDCCGRLYSEEDFAPVQKKSAQPMKDSGSDVFEKTVNGVLEITWNDSQYGYSGSGLLITASGYALTNTHVVTSRDKKTATAVNVKIAGQSVSAKVICLGDSDGGRGKGVDLALIKLTSVPLGAVTLGFADSERIKNGERVYTIGNALGYGTCITEGIISDKLRNVNGQNLIMTDCAVNHGNSGGPMFNGDGKVTGVIVSGIDQAEGMNFAIPSRTVWGFIHACNQDIKIEKDF